MDATALSLFSYPKLGKPTSFLTADNVWRSPPVASCETVSFLLDYSGTRTCAYTKRDSPSLRRSISGRAFQEDDFRIPRSSGSRSSNREKLIALFKRIQTEISEGNSRSKPKKNSQASEDDSSVETSVPEFLKDSGKETKVKRLKEKRNAGSTQKKRTTKKEHPAPTTQPSADYKLTRLPSNFAKKSPIPSPTPLRSNELQLNNSKDTSSEANQELSRIEAMKLNELKEFAKERGLKRYSKLKKSELVELLRSNINS